MHRTRFLLPPAVLAALAAGAVTAAAHDQATSAAAARQSGPPPLPPASDFVRRVDNRWFPLKPGTVLTYKGEDEGTSARDVFIVTHRTKRIQGIRATVVFDRVFEHGRVVERTHDYYAQDRRGNVWYLGEDTATLKPNGKVESREGTFRVGRDGARAGIMMPAHPHPGQTGWQEFYVGHAQDRFRILNRHTMVHTPAVSSRHAMLVRETTPLEPGVVDHKIYVRGIGVVREATVKGGNERYRLVCGAPPARAPDQVAIRRATGGRPPVAHLPLVLPHGPTRSAGTETTCVARPCSYCSP